MPSLRTVIGWLAVLFIIWWIVTNPSGAANAAHAVGHLFTQAANGLSSFLTSVTH